MGNKRRFDRLFVAGAILVTFLVMLGFQLAFATGARPAPTPVPTTQGGVIVFPFRQGSDPANWGSDGATNYPVTGAILQAGAGSIPGQETHVVITFPQAYQYAPLVVATGVGYDVRVTTVSTSGFLVELVGDVTVSEAVFNWMAVGE